MLITRSMRTKQHRPYTTESKTAPQSFLMESQCNLIKNLFEPPDPSPLGGRPTVNARRCLKAILSILMNGAQWKELP